MRQCLFIIWICLAGSISYGQDVKPMNFSVNAGIGWFHYINTLKIGATRIKEDQVGISFRIFWEPEHKLSLGIESGYYKIYTFEKNATAANPLVGEAKLSALPILLCFKMRILPNFYLTGGPGITILYSEVTALGSTAESSQISLANVQISALYQRPITDHLYIGGEFKFLNFGKTEDYGAALMAEVAYKFRFKPKTK